MKNSDTYWVNIYIAGPLDKIEQTCREFFSNNINGCVTVTPTNYIYTYGEQSGAIIGIINYPRFPKSKDHLMYLADTLAKELLIKCCQGSYTIMTPEKTHFYSRRKEE